MPKTIDDYLKELDPETQPQGPKTIGDYIAELETESVPPPPATSTTTSSRDRLKAIAEEASSMAKQGVEYVKHPIDTAEEFSKRIGKSVSELPGTGIKAVGGAVDALERYDPVSARSLEGLNPTIGNTIQAVGQELIDRPNIAGYDFGWTKELGLAPDPKRDDEALMAGASSVNSLLLAAATPGGVAGKTLMGTFLQSQGQADEAKRYILEHGGTEDEANKEAAWQFVANLPAGALESVQWGMFMKRFGGKNILDAAEKKWGATAAKRLFRAGVEQGAVEGLEEVGQGLIGDVTARHYDPTRQIGKDAWMNFKVGGVMGGGMGVVPQAGVELARKYMGKNADWDEKTPDQKLEAAKNRLKEAKAKTPDNDKLIKDLTDLVHIADRVANGQYKADEKARIEQEKIDAQKKIEQEKLKATEEAHKHEQAVKNNADVDEAMKGFNDVTDRPEDQLKILKLKDTSVLDTIGKVQVYNQTAMLEAEAKRQSDIETAQKKAKQEQEAQLKAQQKTATEADKAVGKLDEHANPQKTGVEVGVDGADVIKADPTKAASTLASITNTALPKPDPLSARGVFDQIINAPPAIEGVQQNPGWQPLTQPAAPVQQPAGPAIQPPAPVQQAPAEAQVQPAAPAVETPAQQSFIEFTSVPKNQVVNSKGKQITVYHGTNAEFDAATMSAPAMFSTKKEYAKQLGGRVIEAKLDIRNPADLAAMHISPSDPNFPQIMQELQAQGYDGAHYRGEAWIAFDPRQVKVTKETRTPAPTPAPAALLQPIENVAPVPVEAAAAPAELGDQEVTVTRFNDQGDLVEDTMLAADAKKWADGKLDTLNKLLECLSK